MAAQAVRDGQSKVVEFSRGRLKRDNRIVATQEKNGTIIEFTPDDALFGPDFRFRLEYVEEMLWNYAFLNRGLTLTLNGRAFKSENGLRDLLQRRLTGETLYPIIHIEADEVHGERGYQIVERHSTTPAREAEALDAVRQATEMRWQYMTGLHRAYVLKEEI